MMKKLFLAATLLLGTLAMTSCNNGAYDANPDINNSNVNNPLNVPGGDYFMTCKINGAQYTGNGFYIATINGGIASFTSNGTIAGDNGDYQFVLSLTNYAGVKAYPESGGGMGIALVEKSKPGDPYSSANSTDEDAKITITEVTDTYVNGTFEGTLTNGGNANRKVTEGSFHVKRM